jgi:dimethylsulfoniopropionate demethylase
MVRMTHWDPGTTLSIETPEGSVEGIVKDDFWHNA